jgi:hypothetical protein
MLSSTFVNTAARVEKVKKGGVSELTKDWMKARSFENARCQQSVLSTEVVLIRAIRLPSCGLGMQFPPQVLLDVGMLGNPEDCPCHRMGCNV